MRPLRLLLSLSSSLIAITVLLYISFGSQRHETSSNPGSSGKKSKFRALFSFTSPSSLFPPSAIISLTDDNSTFFLARPAAFGPLLPSKGLSGQLWIGSGFGDDTMGRGGTTTGTEGELGCSDVPGWSDGGQNLAGSVDIGIDSKRKSLGTSESHDGQLDTKAGQRLRRGEGTDGHDTGKVAAGGTNDGTDDYLHHPLPNSDMPKGHGAVGKVKASEHADIQSLQEGAEIAGKIVLLSRGGCGFLEKVKWAQRRGGVALIVGDDIRGGPLIRMYAHGDTSNITIPALFTSHTTAHLLSSLIPSGGYLEDISPEDVAKLGINNAGADSKGSEGKENPAGKQDMADRPTFTRTVAHPAQTPKAGKGNKRPLAKPSAAKNADVPEQVGWFHSILSFLGFGNGGRSSQGGDSRRPPSSGNIDWVLVEDWNDDQPAKKATKPKPTSKRPKVLKPTPTKASDDFVIGVQDWRDPDLLPQTTSANHANDRTNSKEAENGQLKGGSILPGSGEYEKQGKGSPDGAHTGPNDDATHDEESKGWLRGLLGNDGEDDNSKPTPSKRADGGNHLPQRTKAANAHIKEDGEHPDDPDRHEGLWVTLTPTNMSSSPFFDTLLVLVISPLVTLTVVYALLLLRSRIRRRRWRAPKSVVERLPVRTYHTISSDTNSGSSPVATPVASSPTTPLLQHSHSRATLSRSRPRSRTASEVPATSSFRRSRQRCSSPEEEKREAGLAGWRRRYGGRQKECVVCLEEYVDGVSRVMSLPCGHEFHAECITPWLVTRRRTCPICKGDVVRSLTQAHHARSRRSSSSPSRSNHSSPYRDDPDVQIQAAETRNDSPSAAFPVPTTSASASGAAYGDFDADVEGGWDDDGSDDEGDRGRDRRRDGSQERGGGGESSGSGMRDLRTVVWRGLEALRGAGAGLQRRSRGEVDRDR